MEILKAQEVLDKYYEPFIGRKVKVYILESKDYASSTKRPENLYSINSIPFDENATWVSYLGDVKFYEDEVIIDDYYTDVDYNYVCAIFKFKYKGFDYELSY